jgi:hypothetical protein
MHTEIWKGPLSPQVAGVGEGVFVSNDTVLVAVASTAVVLSVASAIPGVAREGLALDAKRSTLTYWLYPSECEVVLWIHPNCYTKTRNAQLISKRKFGELQ